MNKSQNNPVGGFTLVEMLAVIAIAGVLLAVAGPAVSRAYTRAKAWSLGVQDYANARVDAFCDGTQAEQEFWSTNAIRPRVELDRDQQAGDWSVR